MDRTFHIYRKNDLKLADCNVSYDETEEVKYTITEYKPAVADDDPLSEFHMVIPLRHHTLMLPFVAFESMDALLKADKEMAADALNEDLSDCNFTYFSSMESRHLISSEGNALGVGALYSDFSGNVKKLSFISAYNAGADGSLDSNSLETNYALLQRMGKAIAEGTLVPVEKQD